MNFVTFLRHFLFILSIFG
ncbi:HAMP domain protein, partial [Vibrio harveyi]